jgi:L-lactate dehydrogenase complex protein LldG
MTHDADTSRFIATVTRALGRTSVVSPPPETLPTLDEPTVRLVYTDLHLGKLFATRARANKILVTPVRPEECGTAIADYLAAQGVGSVGHSVAPILSNLGVPEACARRGMHVTGWGDLTLDASYQMDACITDTWEGGGAVAETGSLVVRAGPHHGRALSLVPPIHVAVLEPRLIVADLVDLMERLSAAEQRPQAAAGAGRGSATVIITGPSKTADIEMNLVTGVHGPGTVHVFLLD